MIKKLPSFLFLLLVLAFVYAPIILLVIYSFTDSVIIGKWDGFSLNLYKEIFINERVRTMIINTITLAVIVAVLSTIIGTLGAIGLFYSKGRLGKVVKGASSINIINAEIVIALSLALVFSFFAFNKTYYSLVLGQMALCTPFVVLSVNPKLKQLDGNMYEAALDLGATPFQALWKVVLPEILPGILSGFMVAITLSLDDYIITAFTKPATFDTISTYAFNAVKNQAKSDLPALRAVSAIIFLIILSQMKTGLNIMETIPMLVLKTLRRLELMPLL